MQQPQRLSDATIEASRQERTPNTRPTHHNTQAHRTATRQRQQRLTAAPLRRSRPFASSPRLPRRSPQRPCCKADETSNRESIRHTVKHASAPEPAAARLGGSSRACREKNAKAYASAPDDAVPTLTDRYWPRKRTRTQIRIRSKDSSNREEPSARGQNRWTLERQHAGRNHRRP